MSTKHFLQRSSFMKRTLYLVPLLALTLSACAQYRGMMGQGGPGPGPGPAAGQMTQAQHMEAMKTMRDHMASTRQTTDPAARQKMMEDHMKMMDDHMARMQSMPCGRM
jgi:hypothetical protein